MVPVAECRQRILSLQTKLRHETVDAALLVYPIDVYYFTGTRQNALLWIPAESEPILLVRKSFSRAKQESAIDDVRPFPSSRELPALFSEGVRKIGLTFDVLPVQQYQFYASVLRGMEFVDISSLNRELRSVKSAWELEQLRESGRRLCEVFRQAPSFLMRGMRERDLAAELEYRLRRDWSEGSLRMRAFNQEITGLAVAGENASAPGCFDGPVTGRGLSNSAPYGPSGDLIPQGVPILIDYPGVFNGYIVDMTRIFAFGDLDPELKKAFAVSLDIQEYLKENLRPGNISEELFSGALKLAGAAGLGEKFMGYTGEQAKFVGHGVGLELDELPVLARRFTEPLQEGQTIAIEPKFVFPGVGVVGIENTFAVTNKGGERLTNLPDDLVYL